MKLRKLSLILGASLGAMAVVALASCGGSSSKNITYKDAEGNEQTVTVQATSDKDQVAAAATAIAYSEGDKTFKPYGIAETVKLDFAMSGKQDSKSFNWKLNVNEYSAMSYGENLKVADSKGYQKLNVSAELPIKAIATAAQSAMGDLMLEGDDALTSLVADTTSSTPDLTSTQKVEAEVVAYSEALVEYVTLNKLTLPYTDLGISDDMKTTIEGYVGKVLKIDAGSLINANSLFGSSSLVDSSLLESVEGLTTNSSYTDDLQKALDQYKAIEGNPFTALYTTGVKSQEEFKTMIASYASEFGLQISAVSGDKLTFKLAPTADMLGDKFSDYTGKSYVALTINMVTKAPVSIEADLKDISSYALTKSLPVQSTTETGVALPVTDLAVSACKLSIDLEYNPTVQTIDSSKKESATDITPVLAGLFTQFMM